MGTQEKCKIQILKYESCIWVGACHKSFMKCVLVEIPIC